MQTFLSSELAGNKTDHTFTASRYSVYDYKVVNVSPEVLDTDLEVVNHRQT